MYWWDDESVFEQNMAMRCEIKALRRQVDEFKSGKRYLKIQDDNRRVINGYKKEISKLKKELAYERSHSITVRDTWIAECNDAWKEHLKETKKLNEAIRRLEDKIWEERRNFDDKMAAATMDYEERLYEKDCIIDELKHRLAHMEALAGHDSTNTNIPTSQTPPGKKKRIPNTREKSGRKKGGQPGHEKHALAIPDESEITDMKEYCLDEEGFVCSVCGGNRLIPTGMTRDKYEYDVEVIVKKIKHTYYEYQCLDCGQIYSLKCAPGLRGDVQYGSTAQALILSLTNTVNAAMNKSAMFIAGITGGALAPCEGYVAKLQKRAALGLAQFRSDLKLLLITRAIVYWDDTVVMIMATRGCFRFYGDETIAYYTAHAKKDMAGIDEDNVLALLTSDTKVMHDHNTLNYNKKFSFENIECNQHLERDCQKNSDDTSHEWSTNLKTLIGTTIKERNKAIQNGGGSFEESYIRDFHSKIDKYISDGWDENDKDPKNYGANDERRLLRRLEKYRGNYFMWLEDFSLPTTNNLSERALRPVKSHTKISGQFETVENADYYASIKSYTETCRRNGINEILALKRLCEGNPFTVQEIFSKSPPR